MVTPDCGRFGEIQTLFRRNIDLPIAVVEWSLEVGGRSREFNCSGTRNCNYAVVRVVSRVNVINKQ